MNTRKLIAIITSVAFAGCFAAKKSASPTQADADRGAAKFPGYTLASLNEGKGLYERNCGSCHGLKKPSSESEAEWRRIVPAMAAKVNKNSKVLDAHGEELILQYVITMGGS